MTPKHYLNLSNYFHYKSVALPESHVTDFDVSKMSLSEYSADTEDVFYSGGIIRAYHNHFENNYVDIMIQEWCFNAMCACLDQDSNRVPAGEVFYHEIVGNYFGQLKSAPVCSYFVDHVVDTVNNYYQNNSSFLYPGFINFVYPLVRCHIVDLSPYPDLSWSHQPPAKWPAWQVIYKYCLRGLWFSHYYPPYLNPFDFSNCTYDNTFSDPCKYLIQGHFYHDFNR